MYAVAVARTQALGQGTGPRELRSLLPTSTLGGATNSSKLVSFLIVGALVSGAAQNVLETYINSSAISYIDDLFIILLTVALALRLAHSRGSIATALCFWFAFLLLAFVRSTLETDITTSEIFVLFRQVIMPALLIMIGLVVTQKEWQLLSKTAIFIGVINSLYIILEIFGIRLVDPSVIAARDGLYIFSQGVPGHYLVFDGGSTVIRAGGLFLNPPTAGILIAFTAAAANILIRNKWRIPIVILLSLATLATVSRAGILVLFAGLLMPYALRRMGRIAAYVGFGIIALLIGINLLSEAGTAIHFDGLVSGIRDALSVPSGRGFGYAGNFTRGLETFESAESLAGIAFSAAGIATLLLYVLLLFVLFVEFSRYPSWMAGIALGICNAALFAETAGSINATVPLWICVGIVLSRSRWAEATGHGLLSNNSGLVPPRLIRNSR